MNLLYLVGNGFDCRFGLPTRYSDFLKHYEIQKPFYDDDLDKVRLLGKWKKRLFEMVKEEEKGEDVKWKDLEVTLGKLTSVFESDVDGFRYFYLDLVRSLAAYLQHIEKIEPSQEESEKLRRDLMEPYLYLTAKEQEDFLSKLSDRKWYTDVITFNYTSTFEVLCKDILCPNQEYPIPSFPNRNFEYGEIIHVHGKLTETEILLGVDNPDQIENSAFRGNEDITDILVKPCGNETLGSKVDEECRYFISVADVICLFGLSLGPTDQIWWTSVKERFLTNSSVILLYFYFSPQEKPILATDTRPKRKARQELMAALGIEGSEKKYRDRIFVAVNSEMFPERRNN